MRLTSRGLPWVTWGAWLSLARVGRAVQLRRAHVEQQGFLEVVHHSQTVTVSKHHTGRQKVRDSSKAPHFQSTSSAASVRTGCNPRVSTQSHHKYRNKHQDDTCRLRDAHGCADLQAVGGVEGQAGDLLRRLPAHPHQLDHQLHLVARRLLQRGAPHPAPNTQRGEAVNLHPAGRATLTTKSFLFPRVLLCPLLSKQFKKYPDNIRVLLLLPSV